MSHYQTNKQKKGNMSQTMSLVLATAGRERFSHCSEPAETSVNHTMGVARARDVFAVT